MMGIVRRENLPIFRLITVAALAATLMAHLATFAGIDARDTLPLLDLSLIAGGMALTAAFLALLKLQWPKDTPAEAVLALFPAWAKYLTGVAFAYSFCDFAIHWFSAEGTQASIDGVYYLIGWDKHTLRQISYEEYRALSMDSFRMRTGGLLPCYVWLTTSYVFLLR
jgi:hypothetical protein